MKTGFSTAFVLLIAGMVGLCGCSDDTTCNEKNHTGWAVGTSDGEYGTILNTKDGGSTWIRQGDSTQLPNAGFSDICIIDTNKLLVVGDPRPDGTYNVFKSVDGGNTWISSGSDSLEDVAYNGIFALDENNIWIVGEHGAVYYSTDFADSWLKIEVPEEYREDIFHRIAAKSADDIWVVGHEHVNDPYPIMLHTTDGGTAWERLNPIRDLDVDAGIEPDFLGIKLFGNSVWAIGGRGGFIIRSADNGATWEDITVSGGIHDANDIFPLSETEAYVVEDFGQIYSTNDGGVHWTQYYAATNNWLLGVAVLDRVHLWICGSPAGYGEYSVIKYSSDAGTTWREQTPQLLVDNPLIGLYKIRFIDSY